MLDGMKTLTTREFFHSPGLIRPIKTAEDLRREAREIFPGDRPKVNFTAIMKSLKK